MEYHGTGQIFLAYLSQICTLDSLLNGFGFLGLFSVSGLKGKRTQY